MMKCEQLIGPANNPRRCTVPATYTVKPIDPMAYAPTTTHEEHLCVLHARKTAKVMDRSFWQVTRDIDGLAL